MGLDMSSLVKEVVLDAFARPIDVTYAGTDTAYRARGYFGTTALDVMGEDNSILSDQTTYLDVRDREFAVVPRQGDRITIPGDGTTEEEGDWEVVDSSKDGGGLTTLTIRRAGPARPPIRQPRI
jgi:hypothetical protein